MSKRQTLIIHPPDPTTDFLKRIYEGKPARAEEADEGRVRSRVAESDQVVCLGHGFTYGLFDSGRRVVIDDSFACALRDKPRNIYIWCFAKEYVERNQLKGFATGMFISESPEAGYFNVEATERQIEYSNELFAQIIRASLHLPPEKVRENVMDRYVDEGNAVVAFNRERMYCFN